MDNVSSTAASTYAATSSHFFTLTGSASGN
jgi:hypothetical protein